MSSPRGGCALERGSSDCDEFSGSDGSSHKSDEEDDSVELSESESITDVTPLNSPYCNSPLPQAKISDPQQNRPDSYDFQSGTEVNVLIQAIQKLEVERNEGKNAGSVRKKKSYSSADKKHLDPDSQRLYKQVVSSQQNRSKASHERLYRKSTVVNRHKVVLGSINGDIHAGKESAVKQLQRKQKCLSHPSSTAYTHSGSVKRNSCDWLINNSESVENVTNYSEEAP